MTGLTVYRAEERLVVERRKRSKLTETISGLESSQRCLKQVAEEAQTRRNHFVGNELDINFGDWQGTTANQFHSSHIEMISGFTAEYLKRLRNAISAIDGSIGESTSQLTRINATISDLERVIATGGI